MRRRVQKLSTSYFAALHASNRRLSENVPVAAFSVVGVCARAFKGKLLPLLLFVFLWIFCAGANCVIFYAVKAA